MSVLRRVSGCCASSSECRRYLADVASSVFPSKRSARIQNTPKISRVRFTLWVHRALSIYLFHLHYQPVDIDSRQNTMSYITFERGHFASTTAILRRRIFHEPTTILYFIKSAPVLNLHIRDTKFCPRFCDRKIRKSPAIGRLITTMQNYL